MTIDIVTSLADSGPGSLRAVLAGAQAGDTITFATGLAGGTIVLSSTLTIGRSITIDGATSGGDITLDGNHTVTDISASNVTATLAHLIIANGFAHGADAVVSSEEYRAAEAAGGGLVAYGATLTLSDVIFTGNVAIGGDGTGSEFLGRGEPAGGAILAYSSALILAGVSFIGNSATAGDSAFQYVSGGSTGETGVSGASAGGAIAAFDSSLVMTGTSFAGNAATGGNGGAGAGPYYTGPGGGGGAGGVGAGAILLAGLSTGTVAITASDLTFSANSGVGGYGGQGGRGSNTYAGGAGGAPGQPGEPGSPGTGEYYGRNGGAPGEHGLFGDGDGGGGGGGGGLGYANSNVEITCFLAGTCIRTPHGDVPIERLAIGDLVLTHGGEAHPIRWIGRRAYAAPFVRANCALCPVHIAPGAFGPDLPVRPLLLSQNHALFFADNGGVLVNAGDLVNGTFITLAAPAEVHFFHIELDRHEIILAEGVPAESFLDADCRNLFANAADYARLYPAPRAPSEPYAPRLAHGPVFAAIRARLACPPPPAPPGPMEGQLDHAGPTLEGWVRDRANPDYPVEVELVENGAVIARDTANRLRRDLAAAGIGQGRHGYRFARPAGAWLLRRAADGAILPGTPHALPPCGLPGPLRGHVERIGGGVVEGWVQDLANPLHPVAIEIVAQGQVVACAAADRFRGDLAASGIGAGRHGYRVVIEPEWGDVCLQRAADGAALPGTLARLG